jgi:DNA polymerase-3 subunit alpha
VTAVTKAIKTTTAPGFVHLHVHSSYSLLEGALTIARLAELAKSDHQPALALTDTDNMFGALEFSAKMAEVGIQPIIGCALAVDFGDSDHGPRPPGTIHSRDLPRIVLLASREEGYRNLMRLNSRAFLGHTGNEPAHVRLDWLTDATEGLIVLTGGPGGPLDRAIAAGQPPLAAARGEALAGLFGDRLYVELQRHGAAEERAVERALVDFAYAKGLPLVAANEPLFATAEDYEAHDALICIAAGRLVAEADRPHLTPEHRFKTRAEMVKLFADVPEALAASVEIAERCAFRPSRSSRPTRTPG